MDKFMAEHKATLQSSYEARMECDELTLQLDRINIDIDRLKSYYNRIGFRDVNGNQRRKERCQMRRNNRAMQIDSLDLDLLFN